MSAIKKSIREKIIEILTQNVGKYVKSQDITNQVLSTEWGRTLRSLRAEGWDISNYNHEEKGYILKSLTKIESLRIREKINQKLRYQILNRDNSQCQRCGRKATDGAVLHVDHKIPVDWGGSSSEENLWTLCSECNQGKKNLFSDFDSEIMTSIMAETSASRRLIKYFELKPNTPIEPSELDIISGIRDWERTLRHFRQKNNMDIKWVRKEANYLNGYYIYFSE